jgi:hypothetical protein
MGYNFVMGYDILIDKMIGFMEGGSNGLDYEYNKLLIEKYLKLNKQQRLVKYQLNCCTTPQSKVKKNKYNTTSNKNIENIENIEKYLELLIINLSNVPNYFNYFNEMKLNILDN